MSTRPVDDKSGIDSEVDVTAPSGDDSVEVIWDDDVSVVSDEPTRRNRTLLVAAIAIVGALIAAVIVVAQSDDPSVEAGAQPPAGSISPDPGPGAQDDAAAVADPPPAVEPEPQPPAGPVFQDEAADYEVLFPERPVAGEAAEFWIARRSEGVTSIEIDFGDGTTESVVFGSCAPVAGPTSVAHTFAAAGTFDIVMTVTTEGPCPPPPPTDDGTAIGTASQIQRLDPRPLVVEPV